jgi:hypothetical protein
MASDHSGPIGRRTALPAEVLLVRSGRTTAIKHNRRYRGEHKNTREKGKKGPGSIFCATSM